MPTVLRQFPEQNRNGMQQTPYVQIPVGIDTIHLEGQAAASVLSDTGNAITFTILASPTGSDADARILAIEPWQGFIRFNRFTQQDEPNPIDVAFGLDARRRTERISLRAVFNRPMVVGATLTGLP